MWRVVRRDPNGFEGFKDFKTEAEAREWYNSPGADEDREFGYYFYIKFINDLKEKE